MAKRGLKCRCIRCREVRRRPVDPDQLSLREEVYETDATTEHFLSFETSDHIAGFLRLSLPKPGMALPISELSGHAIIREVHVYGPALPIGEASNGEAQHIGLGRQLIGKAQEIARDAGFSQLAVISAIGTREYYARLGFELDGLYMTKVL
jgi:elongator complex protein 3